MGARCEAQIHNNDIEIWVKLSISYALQVPFFVPTKVYFMLVFSTGIISLGGLKGSVMRRGIHVFKVTGKFIIRYTTVGVDRAKILPVQVEPIQVVPIGKLGKKLILIRKKFKIDYYKIFTATPLLWLFFSIKVLENCWFLHEWLVEFKICLKEGFYGKNFVRFLTFPKIHHICMLKSMPSKDPSCLRCPPDFWIQISTHFISHLFVFFSIKVRDFCLLFH